MRKLEQIMENSPFVSQEYKNYILEMIKKHPQVEEKLILAFEKSNQNWQKSWEKYISTNKKISNQIIHNLDEIKYLDHKKNQENIKLQMKLQEQKEKDESENLLLDI